MTGALPKVYLLSDTVLSLQALMMYSIIAQTSIQASMHAVAEGASQQPRLPAFSMPAAQRVKQLNLAFSGLQRALQQVCKQHRQ